MPWAASAAWVPVPMAATSAPARQRASRCWAAASAKKASTPFALVNTTQWYASIPAIASASGRGSVGGAISMAGNSRTCAPRSSREDARADAWWRARVTTTVLPNSGLRSAQDRRPRSAATCPTTITAGFSMPSSPTRSSREASGAHTVRCIGQVP